jgi:hypothetical protein
VKNGIHKCSLCGETYTGYGNKAQPYKGRCCDSCYSLYVVPARASDLHGKTANLRLPNNKDD